MTRYQPCKANKKTLLPTTRIQLHNSNIHLEMKPLYLRKMYLVYNQHRNLKQKLQRNLTMSPSDMANIDLVSLRQKLKTMSLLHKPDRR